MRKVITENSLATEIISELKRTIRTYKLTVVILSVYIMTFAIALTLSLVM